MFKLMDNEPLDAQELAEQCFTLAYLLSGLEHPGLKESLIYILLEKQSALLSLLCTVAKNE
ncbi:hypothetical protein [Budvicia aquatica]|uniref:hypothetical protein n=1 Tax=Budvicia aquatica TaxID=82979 RepID=UPI002081AF60|nr:hypothetical protein [Budvicia aquatica]GKX53837.1 hypothetical protein SOASR029_41460 [Budvicia aquatica]